MCKFSSNVYPIIIIAVIEMMTGWIISFYKLFTIKQTTESSQRNEHYTNYKQNLRTIWKIKILFTNNKNKTLKRKNFSNIKNQLKFDWEICLNFTRIFNAQTFSFFFVIDVSIISIRKDHIFPRIQLIQVIKIFFFNKSVFDNAIIIIII